MKVIRVFVAITVAAATLFIGYHAALWVSVAEGTGYSSSSPLQGHEEGLAVIAAVFVGMFFIAGAILAFLLIAPLKGREPHGAKMSDTGEEQEGGVYKSLPPQFRKPKDLFIFLMDKFDADGGEIINFQYLENRDIFVQVVLTEEESSLNFFYPYDEKPDKLLRARRVKLSGGYELSDWDQAEFATYSGPRESHAKIANVVDAIFKKLLDVPADYVAIGWID